MKKIIIDRLLREYRTRNRLTQEELGRLIGVSPQAVSKWERTECYPDITFLPDIARLLDCTVNDFFCD